MPDSHESGSVAERDGDHIYNPHEERAIREIMYLLNCADIYSRRRFTHARPVYQRATIAEIISAHQRAALVRFAGTLRGSQRTRGPW